MDGTALLTWVAILACLSQSAMFSGLNLACFSLDRLDLEVQVANGSAAARRVLRLRDDANLLLATILWGNVAINVLLTLLSGSVLAGAAAFLFSTVVITIGGEILPQAYFSRNALRMAATLAPVLRFYEVILAPVAWPTARALDAWLGREGVAYLGERDFRRLLRAHIAAPETDVDRVEGTGALNFLAIDELPAILEGEPVDPASIVVVEFDGERPRLRAPAARADAFHADVHRSGRKWVVLVDPGGAPRLALDADGFLRAAAFDPGGADPLAFCHRPLLVSDPATTLGALLPRLEAGRVREDDVIARDIVLVWTDEERRIITGADLLGRLLRGIARPGSPAAAAVSPGPPRPPARPAG